MKLTIKITDICNYNCSFCIEKKIKEKSIYGNNIDDSIFYEILTTFLEKNKDIIDETVNITGGEPFINLEKLSYVLDILEHFNKRAYISTNGYFLNNIEIINAINKKNIIINLGINGLSDEKNIYKLTEEKVSALEKVLLMNQIKNFGIKRVVTTKNITSFCNDVIFLFHTFKNVINIQNALNFNELSKFNIKHFFDLDIELFKLHQYAGFDNIKEIISFNDTPQEKCNCFDYISLYPDGKFYTFPELDGVPEDFEYKNCIKMEYYMGKEKYFLFKSMLNKYGL